MILHHLPNVVRGPGAGCVVLPPGAGRADLEAYVYKQ